MLVYAVHDILVGVALYARLPEAVQVHGEYGLTRAYPVLSYDVVGLTGDLCCGTQGFAIVNYLLGIRSLNELDMGGDFGADIVYELIHHGGVRVVDVYLFKLLQGLYYEADVALTLYAAAEHTEGFRIGAEGFRSDCGNGRSTHCGDPCAVHYGHGVSCDELVEHQNGRSLREAPVFGIAGVAFYPLAAHRHLAGDIGGHSVVEYVVVRVYTYLGGHFVFFFAVCDKCLAYGCYCVLHSGAVLHALGLGQVQRFAADLHMLFDPLLFCEQFRGVSHFIFLLY